MTALSTAQRSANYRRRKAAKDFAVAFFDGRLHATAEEFVEAKEDELSRIHNVTSVSINAGLVQYFYEALKDYQSDDEKFHTTDLLAAWKTAEARND